MSKLADFVQETATGPGTGPFLLEGAPVGRRLFSAAFPSGGDLYYFARDDAQAEWGIGSLDVSGPITLTRTTVRGTTAGSTAPLNFAGTVTVYNEVPAEYLPLIGPDGLARAGDLVLVDRTWLAANYADRAAMRARYRSAGWLPPGVVMDCAAPAAPDGWLLCYGQAISRTDYARLFAAIGTLYGAGDGATTFALPDLRGRLSIGLDSAAGRVTAARSGINGAQLGAAGGSELMAAHTHGANDPGHNHILTDPGHSHGPKQGSGFVVPQGTGGEIDAIFAGGGRVEQTATARTARAKTGLMIGGAVTGLTLASAGGGNSQNMPPAIMLNRVIYTGLRSGGVLPPDGNAAVIAIVQAMSDSLWAYLQRATGAAATAAGMPPLITAEGLVKNNQFVGAALGGYTADGVCSSEGIALMLRGVVSAYLADRDPAKLAYAKFLFNAACTYFFYNTKPTAAAAPLWHHSWMVNGGAPFAVRGPLAANGDLAESGVIGEAVTFTAGVGQLASPPDVVYQVVTGGTQFVWQNVFSDIAPDPTTGLPTGYPVNVAYYIDKDGNRVYGTQKSGSFGQPIVPNSGETPGKIVLADTSINGTCRANYCVTVPDVQIAYGEVYEAWPMWRKMGATERTAAGDALHWLVDSFRLLQQAEPDNADWQYAQARLLDVWQLMCSQESDGTYMFRAGADGPYNNYPLTYSYADGFAADGTTRWAAQPPSHYTAARTSDGYVTFTLPLADGSSGLETRSEMAFECQALFLSWTAANTSISLDIVSSVDQVLALIYRPHHDAGTVADRYSCLLPVGPSHPGPYSVPMRAFKVFSGSVWTADRGYYTFGSITDIVRASAAMPDGSQMLTIQMDMTAAYAGFGISRANVYPFATWSSPPGIYYAAASNLWYCVQDANGWLWVTQMPAAGTLDANGKLVPAWRWFQPDVSRLILNTAQPGTGDTPTVPALGGTNYAQGITIQSDTDNLGPLYVAYVAAEQPAQPPTSEQNIDVFTIQSTSTDAFTLKVGDVQLVNGIRTPIKYYGSAPFGLQINGPSRSNLSVVPYRGPYITGYQSGTPWIDIGNGAKLQQMLQFMADAQDQFAAAHPQHLRGPFAHCYLPAIWDSVQVGAVDSWVYDAPDGNPAWTGWQWRAFDAMAHTWYLAKQKGLAAAALAGQVAGAYLTWIYGWLRDNPDALYVPSEWGPPGWTQGQPWPAGGYLDPHGTTREPHDMALCLKGAIACGLAGAGVDKVKYIVGRCIRMLQAVQVVTPTDPVRGAFTLNPAGYEVYGFAQGEILDGISHALRYPQFVPDTLSGDPPPAPTLLLENGSSLVTEALLPIALEDLT
ncbi:phage tail protein [Gluconacetobacter sp. Hr-1-5]|uniref:phage tail protein n=1 Tax=Gluconacetobacter sp. Hr-1-5 TaxID=3395370 RepID=UPI003B525FDB